MLQNDDLYNIHPFPVFIKCYAREEKDLPGRTTASAPRRVEPEFQGRVNAEEAEQLLSCKQVFCHYIIPVLHIQSYTKNQFFSKKVENFLKKEKKNGAVAKP